MGLQFDVAIKPIVKVLCTLKRHMNYKNKNIKIGPAARAVDTYKVLAQRASLIFKHFPILDRAVVVLASFYKPCQPHPMFNEDYLTKKWFLYIYIFLLYILVRLIVIHVPFFPSFLLPQIPNASYLLISTIYMCIMIPT